MKSTSILILSLSILLFSISCSSQEELKDKLSLMPWPKEINENTLSLMKNIKQQFDPNNILNPEKSI